jgi:hypothetical protein
MEKFVLTTTRNLLNSCQSLYIHTQAKPVNSHSPGTHTVATSHLSAETMFQNLLKPKLTSIHHMCVAIRCGHFAFHFDSHPLDGARNALRVNTTEYFVVTCW